MKLRLLAVIGLLLTMAVPAFAQDDTAEPQRWHFVCEWGLLVVEQPTEPPAIFIDIDSPTNNSAVEGTQVTVSGTGAGLFEANLVVEATANGEMIFSEPTLLRAESMGAVGTWSIDIDLGELEGPTPVYIVAYSQSPEDGSTIAADAININANSTFPLRYVDITRPTPYAAVSTLPLLVEGTAGAAFENNVVIEVRDPQSGIVLAETFATVQTDELGGSGPFSAELMVDVEPGTAIDIVAFQPAIAEGESDEDFSDVEFAVASPLAQTYDRFVILEGDDPLFSIQQPCSAELAFEDEDINPLVINNVLPISTMSMMPLVNLTIEAAGSSVCPSPLRTRATRDGDAFDIEIYYDISEPAACSADLAPITKRISLGTLPNPDFSITVNGEPVE